MALSHQNTVNEYLVETGPEWPNVRSLFSNSSKTELAALRTQIAQLNIHIYFLERQVDRYAALSKEIILSKQNAVKILRNENDDIDQDYRQNERDETIHNLQAQVSNSKIDQEDIEILDALRSVQPP